MDNQKQKLKLGEDGERLCESNDCDMPATHSIVWTEDRQYHCLIHINQILNIGAAMGFNTPAHTVRPMTFEEMLPEPELSPAEMIAKLKQAIRDGDKKTALKLTGQVAELLGGE